MYYDRRDDVKECTFHPQITKLALQLPSRWDALQEEPLPKFPSDDPEATFKPSINNYRLKNKKRDKDVVDLFQDEKRTQEKKKQELKNQIEQTRLQECSFSPAILNYSKSIQFDQTFPERLSTKKKANDLNANLSNQVLGGNRSETQTESENKAKAEQKHSSHSITRSDLLYMDAVNRQMKQSAVEENVNIQTKQKMEASKVNNKSIVLLQANVRNKLDKVLASTPQELKEKDLRTVFLKIGFFQEDESEASHVNDKRMLEELELLNKVKASLDFGKRGVPLINLRLFLEELMDVLLNVVDIHTTINRKLIKETISFIRANVSIKRILDLPSKPGPVQKEEVYSFKPQIDRNSKKMQKDSTEPRHELLFNKASHSQKVKQELSQKVLQMQTAECTFKPTTNKSGNLKSSVLAGPKHEHLYNLHKARKDRKEPEVPSHIQPQLKECTFTPQLVTKGKKKPNPQQTPKGYAASIARMRYGNWSSVLNSKGLDEAFQIAEKEQAQEEEPIEHEEPVEEEEDNLPSFLIEVNLGKEGKKMIGITQGEDHFQVIRQFALDFNLTPSQFFELLEKVTEALDTKP